MATEYITLSPSDLQFQNYLEGRLQAGKRALPEKTFGLGTSSERITFRVFAENEIAKPSKLKVIWASLRPAFLSLTLGPLLVVSLQLMNEGWLPPLEKLSVIYLSLMFLHFSVFLFNDYYDHIHGQDRHNRRRGSQIIQRGWEPAYIVRRWALLNLVLGASLGVYLALQSPLLWIVGGIAFSSVLFFSKLRDLKFSPFADLVTFLCFGPLLVYGFLVALEAPLEGELLLASGAFGALSVLGLHLKNWENLYHETLSGSRHLMVRLGLDKGRRLILLEIVATTLWMAAWFYDSQFSLILAPFVLLPALYLFKRVASVRSPMSSQLKGLGELGLWWHGAFVLLMSLFLLLRV